MDQTSVGNDKPRGRNRQDSQTWSNRQGSQTKATKTPKTPKTPTSCHWVNWSTWFPLLHFAHDVEAPFFLVHHHSSSLFHDIPCNYIDLQCPKISLSVFSIHWAFWHILALIHQGNQVDSNMSNWKWKEKTHGIDMNWQVSCSICSLHFLKKDLLLSAPTVRFAQGLGGSKAVKDTALLWASAMLCT